MTGYVDDAQIPAWNRDAANWAWTHGIVRGVPTPEGFRYDGHREITRAEVVELLFRFDAYLDGAETPQEPVPEPPVVVPDPDPTPTPPPVTGRPERSVIIASAGLADPSKLRPSGTVTITQNDAVVENLDVSGSIVVRADRVTVRNCRVRGSSSRSLIYQDRVNGYQHKGLIVEHCDVEVTGSALGGIGYLGRECTVRFCHVHGREADGIKIEEGSSQKPSVYEWNYVHMTKAPGSQAHLDGMQASADSHWLVRNSVIDMPAESGGNAAILAQCWNGAANSQETNWSVRNNYLRGGNFTLYTSGGKDTKPNYSTPTNVVVVGNVFEGAFRYGHWRNAVKPADLVDSNNSYLGD